MVSELPISEIYGPVFQGEGMDIGKPCVFLRVMHCPVKCPGCDTSFTWNGTEKGTKLRVLEWSKEDDSRDLMSVQTRLDVLLKPYPGCGIVVSGGEPLLYYKNKDFIELLNHLRVWHWIGLETSGFIGKSLVSDADLFPFVNCFTSVHISPKITPCLHGQGYSDKELTRNVESLIGATINPSITKLAFKFVCRDKADVDVVVDYVGNLPDVPIYLMPYGQDPEEIQKTSEFLLPYCAKHGYILSPRLQSLFYGAKRGI